MKDGTGQASKTKKRQKVLHLKMKGDLLDKFDEMKAADRRTGTEFLRLLIEDEWIRREAKAKRELVEVAS